MYGTNDLGLSSYNSGLRQCSRQTNDVGFMENKVTLIHVYLRMFHFSLAIIVLFYI